MIDKDTMFFVKILPEKQFISVKILPEHYFIASTGF
jgi:hypothetical protein